MTVTTIYRVVPVAVCAASLTFAGCWAVAAGAGAEAGYVASQPNRTTTETVEDQRIVASVKAKLLADPDVSGLKINVDSFRGKVDLKGVVDSQSEIDRAVTLASSVEGVRSVRSQLYVSRD